MPIELFQHHHDNYFQLVGYGQINFHNTGTNVFITPVPNGDVSLPPECVEDLTYTWNVEAFSIIPEENQATPSLPDLRLRRSGQPVFDIFSSAGAVFSNCFARYVRRQPDSEDPQFSLTDGNWGAHNWIGQPDPIHYQLNGTNHLALSRLIYSMLTGQSLTQMQSQDIFDDIFYTDQDASIWLCIVVVGGKTKIKVRIRTANNEYIAILELADEITPPRPRSLSPITSMARYLLRKYSGSAGDVRHPLARSLRSPSSLTKSSPSSGQSTPDDEPAEINMISITNFTVHTGFLIINTRQFHSYIQ